MALFDRTGRKHLPPTSGRIAIGKKNDRKFPQKLDYFIFTHLPDPKTDIAPINVAMTEVMTKKYGPQPREISVVLPYHHPDEVFFRQFADYKSKTDWSCKSEDGCKAQRKQNGKIIEMECNYETCQFRRVPGPDLDKTTCHPNGILSVEIPDSPAISGVWKFRTRGWNSVNEIYQILEKIFEIRGTLKNLTVLLTVRMESQMAPDGKGGRSRQNIPIVSVKAIGTREEIQNGAGTAYGDFATLKLNGNKIGNIADRGIINALDMEMSTAPEIEDSEEELGKSEDQNNNQTPIGMLDYNDEIDNNKPIKTAPYTAPESSQEDDDLF